MSTTYNTTYRPDDHYRVIIGVGEQDRIGTFAEAYQLDFDCPVPVPDVGEIITTDVAPDREKFVAGRFRVLSREWYYEPHKWFMEGEMMIPHGAWCQVTLRCERVEAKV